MSFAVFHDACEEVATQLLGVANDPSSWTMENMGGTVVRCQLPTEDRFYFSPVAIAVFKPLIELHQGQPCNPPRTRGLVPSKTSRMMLGFKTRWEPFVPPRSVAKGIAPEARSGE